MRVVSLAALAAVLTPLLVAGCASDASDDGPESNAGMLTAVGDEPTGSPSRHAIVLAHGFDASDTNRWSFKGVAEALGKDGHLVHKALVAPYRGVPDRAAELAKHVDLARKECAARPPCDDKKVHIVAHSMGGLDARFVVSKLSDPSGTPYSELVASVTTISTPHRGSAVADTILALTPGAASPVINALAGLWARTFTDADLAEGSDVHAALTSISEAATPKFNDDVPNADGVFYQSWAGVTGAAELHLSQTELDACGGKVETFDNRADNLANHDPMSTAQLLISAPIVAHGIGSAGDPNDAMVRVESAKWGAFQGCIPADHMAEVGQRNGSDAPVAWTHFDHVRFYRRLAFGLDAASKQP
jgi:triacylglycerol lipase